MFINERLKITSEQILPAFSNYEKSDNDEQIQSAIQNALAALDSYYKKHRYLGKLVWLVDHIPVIGHYSHLKKIEAAWAIWMSSKKSYLKRLENDFQAQNFQDALKLYNDFPEQHQVQYFPKIAKLLLDANALLELKAFLAEHKNKPAFENALAAFDRELAEKAQTKVDSNKADDAAAIALMIQNSEENIRLLQAINSNELSSSVTQRLLQSTINKIHKPPSQ